MSNARGRLSATIPSRTSGQVCRRAARSRMGSRPGLPSRRTRAFAGAPREVSDTAGYRSPPRPLARGHRERLNPRISAVVRPTAARRTKFTREALMVPHALRRRAHLCHTSLVGGTVFVGFARRHDTRPVDASSSAVAVAVAAACALGDTGEISCAVKSDVARRLTIFWGEAQAVGIVGRVVYAAVTRGAVEGVGAGPFIDTDVRLAPVAATALEITAARRARQALAGGGALPVRGAVGIGGTRHARLAPAGGQQQHGAGEAPHRRPPHHGSQQRHRC